MIIFIFINIKIFYFSSLQPKGNSDIIMHMAKLVDSITVSVFDLFYDLVTH